MSENGLICDSCHAKAEETDTECWNCGHTTFVYEPGNAKNQTPHSNNTPQQLREALQKLEVPKTVVWVDDEMKVETDYLTDKTIDEILALFTTAQIQLVSELEGELPKPQIQLMGKLCDTCGDYMDYCNCARVQSSLLDQLTSWLEHKKQELERGKQKWTD